MKTYKRAFVFSIAYVVFSVVLVLLGIQLTGFWAGILIATLGWAAYDYVQQH